MLTYPQGGRLLNVYDEIRQKLIDRGIPAKEIAYIHDAETDLQKKYYAWRPIGPLSA